MHISLEAETLGYLFGMPITNSLVLSFLTLLILSTVGFFAVKSLSLVPKKVQNGAELIVENILNFMAGAVGSKEQAIKFFPLVASLFLFILFNNWLGVLPGTGSIGFYEIEQGKEVFIPFFRSANSDLNTTLALALISVLAIQFYGIRKFGILGHLGKFFIFNKGPIYLFVGLLEFVGELAKIMSFSFRLFGNIFAGEVLLLIVMTLVPILVPFPFIMMEFFVGFIQALVFAMLTLIFLKIATEGHEEAHLSAH